MREGVFAGVILAIVIVIFALVAQVPAALESMTTHAAATELARGQAAAIEAQAEAQAYSLRSYTDAGVRAIESDRRAAHWPSATVVALVAGVVTLVVGVVTVLALELRRTRAELRAVVAASGAEVTQ